MRRLAVVILTFLLLKHITFGEIKNNYELYNGWTLYNILKIINYDIENSNITIKNVEKCIDTKEENNLLSCIQEEKEKLEKIIKNRKEFLRENLTIVRICQDKLSKDVSNFLFKKRLIGFNSLYDTLYENKLLKNLYSAVVSIESNIKEPVLKSLLDKDERINKLFLKGIWKQKIVTSLGYVKLLEDSKEEIEKNIDFKELIDYYFSYMEKF